MFVKPLSRQEAQQTYWKLGDEWWKQIIDGECHSFGPLVFDLGLHDDKKVEPGFLASLKDGMNYASANLCQPLTIEFYRELHRQLCTHFMGEDNNTLVGCDEIGIFRNSDKGCRFPLSHYVTPEASPHYFIYTLNEYLNYIKSSPHFYATRHTPNMAIHAVEIWKQDIECSGKLLGNLGNAFFETIKDKKNLEKYIAAEAKISTAWIEEHETRCADRVRMLNEYTKNMAAELGFAPFINFYLATFEEKGEGYIRLHYLDIDHKLISMITNTVIDQYNQTMKNLNNKTKFSGTETRGQRKEKLRAIADLFQKLEWLHPFHDGQGRTDLVLLSKLLTENGFHPVIMQQPFTSSFSTLDEWVEELEKGLVAWEVLANQKLSNEQPIERPYKRARVA